MTVYFELKIGTFAMCTKIREIWQLDDIFNLDGALCKLVHCCSKFNDVPRYAELKLQISHKTFHKVLIMKEYPIKEDLELSKCQEIKDEFMEFYSKFAGKDNEQA